MARKVFAAVPNYTNLIRGEVSDAMMVAGFEAAKTGWEFERKRLTGRIHHIARNLLLGLFLHSDSTDLVWWDDDVAILPGNFVRFVEHDVPFVCAAYRHKQDAETYPGAFPPPGQRRMRESASTKTPLFDTLYWPIGFSRQTRGCVEAICNRPEVIWEPDDAYPGVKFPQVFKGEDVFVKDGQRYAFGEDYAYCREWIDLAEGNAVWLDPVMQTGHAGQQIWWGCKAAQMQREVEAYRREVALDDINRRMFSEAAQ